MKYSLSANGLRLTVLNVCRQCADNITDLQVIQCNASNEHGFTFAAGYINVLRMFSHQLPSSHLTIFSHSLISL